VSHGSTGGGTGKIGDNGNNKGISWRKSPGANGSGDGISRVVETVDYPEANSQNNDQDKDTEGIVRHA
jgi:hypothetical protein